MNLLICFLNYEDFSVGYKCVAGVVFHLGAGFVLVYLIIAGGRRVLHNITDFCTYEIQRALNVNHKLNWDLVQSTGSTKLVGCRRK